MTENTLYNVAYESVKMIRGEHIAPTPCNYQKIFILKAKLFNITPKEILKCLCDQGESVSTEDEIRALSEEVLKTIDKVQTTVDFLDGSVSNLIKSYQESDLEYQSEEDLATQLLKLKQENIDMHQKLESVNQDIKEQKQTIQKVYNLVNKDILMNIYSRRYMEDKLKNLMYEYKRYGHMFSVIMMDIDDFKKINDIHGHLTGDMVLMKIGEILRDSLRQTDIPARYGGDEIMVLLPNTTLIFAEKTAQKIRSVLRNIRFRKSYQEFTITMSMGIYEVLPEDTVESIIKKADFALYQSKSDGKNKIVIYKE